MVNRQRHILRYENPLRCYIETLTFFPQLDYTAPEYALSGSISPAADMFSFGMVAYSVFTRSALFDADIMNIPLRKPLFQNNRTWGVFKRNASEFRNLPASRLQEVPADLRDYLKLLLSLTPDLRPTPEQVGNRQLEFIFESSKQVQQLPFFDDFGVKTLTNLDSQFQWDNLQKSQFYKVIILLPSC